MEMWEILVPTVNSHGNPIRVKFHKIWDAKVYAITGGLTILTPAKGKWISPMGELFSERMIPVRIACSREQILEIINMTKVYYNQIAVCAYRVSAEVIIM